MKIINFKVSGLFNSREDINIDFNPKIHVMSGKNGAGKTTILKLMWYFISGNLEKALIEVPFKQAILETDIYILSVTVNKDQDNPFETKITYKDQAVIDSIINDFNLNDTKNHLKYIFIKFLGRSFFFPTFRNIEGGFTTEKYDSKHVLFQNLILDKQEDVDVSLIQDLQIISNKVSNRHHRFVTSVSSSQINNLLISKYAEIMSSIQPYQVEKKNIIDELIKKINLLKIDTLGADKIQEINYSQKKMEDLDIKINELKHPLKRFQDSIYFFLKDYDFHFGKTITFSIKQKKPNITLESSENILAPEPSVFDLKNLSAGEKQILNFVTYNNFFDNTVFFIDEPEISLHADWQRILFRILTKQNPTNQFIITTQSPFIYSKYTKNEICVDPLLDRGDCEELN